MENQDQNFQKPENTAENTAENTVENMPENTVENTVPQAQPEMYMPVADGGMGSGIPEGFNQNEKKKPILLIAILATVAVAIIVAVIIIFSKFGGTDVKSIDDLTLSLGKTAIKYAEEIKTIGDTNPVFKKLQEIGKEKSQHTISVTGMADAVFVNSKEDKRLDMYVTSPSLANSIEFYLSDKDIMLGIENTKYLTSTSETVTDDVVSFMELFGMDEDTIESVEQMLSSVDFSYDGLTTATEVKTEKSDTELQKRYMDLLKKLLDAGEFSVKDETVSYDNNGTNVDRKVQKASLKWTSEEFVAWYEEFISILENDSDMETAMMKMLAAGAGMSSGFQTYEEFIDTLKEALDTLSEEEFTIESIFTIYKGYVIGVEFGIEAPEYDGKANILFEIKGEDNLLDDLYVETDMDGEKNTFSMKGKHVGDKFESVIIIEDSYGSSETINVTWDTAAMADNFKVTGTDIDFTMTLAVDGDTVVADTTIEGTAVSYKAEKIGEVKALPTDDTMPLGDVAEDDLFELYMAILG